MVSSIYKKDFVPNATTINAGVAVLATPVTIGPGELFGGGGGHLRVWFSFILSANQTAIGITNNNNVAPANLSFVNADAGYIVKSGGLYWIDIPIEEGDSINLTSITSPDSAVTGVSITAIRLLRFQKIVFGA